MRATVTIAAIAVIGASCATARERHVITGVLSRADVQYAFGRERFRDSAAASARADSASRFRYAGYENLEGGDQDRGLRFLLAAWRMGVADSSFHADMQSLARLLHCPDEEVRVAREMRRRWPLEAWTVAALARAEAERERVATSPTRRPCRLRFAEPSPR
jgi:hypothetical protein